MNALEQVANVLWTLGEERKQDDYDAAKLAVEQLGNVIQAAQQLCGDDPQPENFLALEEALRAAGFEVPA